MTPWIRDGFDPDGGSWTGPDMTARQRYSLVVVCVAAGLAMALAAAWCVARACERVRVVCEF